MVSRTLDNFDINLLHLIHTLPDKLGPLLNKLTTPYTSQLPKIDFYYNNNIIHEKQFDISDL